MNSLITLCPVPPLLRHLCCKVSAKSNFCDDNGVMTIGPAVCQISTSTLHEPVTGTPQKNEMDVSELPKSTPFK